MHEGGHYSLTGHIATDRALQIAIHGIGYGMSGAWWRNQHNKHHAIQQKFLT
jgi:fatty acid desaturase